MQRISLVVLFACISACSTAVQYANETLDSNTGVTVTTANMPIVLYRDNPSLAAYARNYVNLGPIEVNQMGSYQYFLWVGIWNTLERADAANSRDGFDSVVILADGEPLALDIVGWTPAAIGASKPVYVKPVASAADAYYQVTVDQIRLIAEAHEIRLRTTDASPREYLLWSGQNAARQSFQSFLQATFF